MSQQGYIEIDGKPTFVTVLQTYYCHNIPVTRIVTDGTSIWETHEPLVPDLGYFCGGWFVAQ